MTQVVQNAKQALQDFHNANMVQSAQIPIGACPRVKWKPPLDASLKLNFDGTTFKDIGKAGLGAVIRNSSGQVLASISEQVPLPHTSDIIEALAAAQAISFALELGFSSFILEGDSEVVIKSLKSDEATLSPFGHIQDSAKQKTETSCCISFSHIRRLGNSVAHNLAKHARHVRGFSVWMEDVPPHLLPVLEADYG